MRTSLGWGETISQIDGRIASGVLVFGSPPPRGRDLDLLARPAELAVIGATLREQGFVQHEFEWVSFRGCSAFAIDLVPAESWRLPVQELAALFDEAQPVEGLPHFLVPAAHHELLIAARRQLREPGAIAERRRARLQRLLASNPQAWPIACDRAPLWNARAALTLLGELINESGVGTRRARARAWVELAVTVASSPRSRARAWRRVVRLPRSQRTIVAFSGLDGAGKSTQARLLKETLGRIHVEGAVLWPPAQNLLFGMNPTVKRMLRGVLERTGSSAINTKDESRLAGIGDRIEDPELADVPDFPPLPHQRALVAHMLAGVVACSQILALRRARRSAPASARVLIFDRYTLDAIVYVRQRWGHGRPLRWQCALIRLLSPRPVVAYLLEIGPQRALTRKQDFPLDNLLERAVMYRELSGPLGVRTLDATRPVDDLCAEIAREVWLALRGSAATTRIGSG